jgi:hypothetical protein
MNVSNVAASVALQALSAQSAQQPSMLAAAINAPQSAALALTDAATASLTNASGVLGTLINTYA